MSINQVTPGQDWLETLNNDLADLDGNAVQYTPWEKLNAVFLNGFEDSGAGDMAPDVRFIKNNRGDVLKTEIYGEARNDKFDGTDVAFCMLTGVPLPGKPLLGNARMINVRSSIGTVSVYVSDADYTKHTLTLSIWGQRLDNISTLDGYIAFYLTY